MPRYKGIGNKNEKCSGVRMWCSGCRRRRFVEFLTALEVPLITKPWEKVIKYYCTDKCLRPDWRKFIPQGRLELITATRSKEEKAKIIEQRKLEQRIKKTQEKLVMLQKKLMAWEK